MLRKVTVENYALIDSLDIEFGKGLNIVTGETGAGKSLLLGAVSLVLGGKADTSVLRDREKPCFVEAEFNIAGLGMEPLFRSLDLDYSDITTIRRVISPAGKARGYINDLPASAADMRQVGERLIDIHSQHQTLLIGNPKFQTDLLDSVAGKPAVAEEYAGIYAELKLAEKELAALKSAEADSRRDEDYLRFQHAQLDDARLREGEQQELETLLNELTHASEIRESISGAETILSDDTGVLSQLKSAEVFMRKIEEVFPKGAEWGERLRSAIIDLKDMASEMASEGERIDVDPRKLEDTEARLDKLYSLQQKHRVSSITELMALHVEIGEKLRSMDNFEARIADLESRTAKLEEKAHALAGKITAARIAAAPVVEKYVGSTMESLGMPNVEFEVLITPAGELLPTGADKVKFMFTANRNTRLEPLENVASGGEMSRLMLALKSLAARHRQLPAIIFDEIDTGISGNIADRMGGLIHALSSHLQVINITHLPQVASKGKAHYHVYKEDRSGVTNTRIKRLTDTERITEIAKMLSGSTVTPAAIEQAAVLLKVEPATGPN